MQRPFLSFTALATMSFIAVPALAQTVPVETRVNRLEKEMRAVQRKVFPGGAPIEPELTPSTAAPATPASTTPVSDLIARVNALEAQLATVTGQTEQNTFKLKQLEDALNKFKAETNAHFAPAVAPAASTPAGPKPAGMAPVAPKPVPAKASPPAATATKPAIVKSASSPVTEARKAAVAAIERPNSGNNADDAYTYGYRLWSAKFYPEAQAQLKTTVEKYGATSVGSRAQNLLGRAYLDDGKPALASVAFYENYQKRPRGERAADSLAWLGEALLQLRKPADACKVYDELHTAYGSDLSANLKTMMEKGKARAKCAA